MFQDGPVGNIPPASSVCRSRRPPKSRLKPRSIRRRPRKTNPAFLPPDKPTLTSTSRRKLTEVHPCFQSLPPQQFQALFNSLFKVLFIFPSRYLFAIGLSPVFSLRWNLPPTLGCIPKQPDSSTAPRGASEHRPTGLSPSLASHSRELRSNPPQRSLL